MSGAYCWKSFWTCTRRAGLLLCHLLVISLSLISIRVAVWILLFCVFTHWGSFFQSLWCRKEMRKRMTSRHRRKDVQNKIFCHHIAKNIRVLRKGQRQILHGVKYACVSLVFGMAEYLTLNVTARAQGTRQRETQTGKEHHHLSRLCQRLLDFSHNLNHLICQ